MPDLIDRDLERQYEAALAELKAAEDVYAQAETRLIAARRQLQVHRLGSWYYAAITRIQKSA